MGHFLCKNLQIFQGQKYGEKKPNVTELTLPYLPGDQRSCITGRNHFNISPRETHSNRERNFQIQFHYFFNTECNGFGLENPKNALLRKRSSIKLLNSKDVVFSGEINYGF